MASQGIVMYEVIGYLSTCSTKKPACWVCINGMDNHHICWTYRRASQATMMIHPKVLLSSSSSAFVIVVGPMSPVGYIRWIAWDVRVRWGKAVCTVFCFLTSTYMFRLKKPPCTHQRTSGTCISQSILMSVFRCHREKTCGYDCGFFTVVCYSYDADLLVNCTAQCPL